MPVVRDQRDRDQRIAQLRRQLGTVTSASKHAVPQRQSASVAMVDELVSQSQQRCLTPPSVITQMLPRGGLARGSVVAVEGARSLLLSVIAEVSAESGQVAVVGAPGLNVAAAADMGADLAQVATIPRPGADPVEIAAVLLDGFDLVVLDLAGASVPPSRTRAVMARARAKGAVLMVTGGQWAGAHARISTRVRGYRYRPEPDRDRIPRGGYGRICGVQLSLTCTGRGYAGSDAELELVAHQDKVHIQVAPRPELAVAY